MKNRFSTRGEKPTEFEALLFAKTDPRATTSPWVIIGRRIGLEALCIVLDELGGEDIAVPHRANFIAEIWRPIRNAEIHQLAQSMTQRQIAEIMGLTKRQVQNILRRVR